MYRFGNITNNAFYSWVYKVKFFKIKNDKTLFKIDYLCHNINMKWLDILEIELLVNLNKDT